MILPISHERTTVRNFPWATCLIALALLGTFLLTPRGSEVTEASQRLEEVLAFASHHPYLELDPRAAAAGGRQPRTLPVPEDAPQELLQRELDRKTAGWLEALEENPYHRWGLIPAAPRPAAFISHLFLHAGWLHLGLNFLWLYLCAPFVEDRWGRLPFLLFFLAVGAAAGGLFLLRDPGAFVPLIGASGAIAGVVAAFLVLHGRTKMDFAFLLPIFAGTFSAPAWLMIPLWFGSDFWAVAVQGTARGGGTAYWAHVGGFLTGLALSLGTRLRRPPEAASGTSPSPISRRYRRADTSEREWRSMVRAVRDNPADSVSRDLLWDLARRFNRQRQAVPAICSGVRQALREGSLGEALDRWHRLRQAVPDLPLDPGLLVELASAARRLQRAAEAHDLLESALDHWREDTTFPIVERAHRLARSLGSPLRRSFLRLALAHPQADPRRRRELEAEADGEAV